MQNNENPETRPVVECHQHEPFAIGGSDGKYMTMEYKDTVKVKIMFCKKCHLVYWEEANASINK